MAKGLDALIEELVKEIAYAGENGLTVKGFIEAATRISTRADAPSPRDAAENEEELEAGASDPTEEELGPARLAWEWVVARPEVSVGYDREWNASTLDEVLSLPEGGNQPPRKKTSLKPSRKARGKQPIKDEWDSDLEEDLDQKATRRRADTIYRPRLTVPEEVQWKTLTGHEPDHRKIPPMEWKLLVGIATARHHGILQADVRDLVGQDKRSVPKRTDFLAMKGYITKRTVVAKGAKTSMLWLQGFAPAEITSHASSSLADHQLPEDAQNRDYTPVPWCYRWAGKTIEFEVFGRSIVAILKAYRVMRLIDLKRKMGIKGMRWQMKAMAKFMRILVADGMAKYVAGSMPHDRRVFNDCIRFIKEPTDDEWKHYVAYSNQKPSEKGEKGGPAPAQSKQPAEEKGDDEESDVEEVTRMTLELDATDIYKPLPNRIFDLIQRAGPSGLSTPEIATAVLGPSFVRYIFSYLQNTSVPGRQSKHLAHFQLSKQLVRKGKMKAYMFSVSPAPDTSNQAQEPDGEITAGKGNHSNFPFGRAPAKWTKTSGPETWAQLTARCDTAPIRAKRRGRRFKDVIERGKTSSRLGAWTAQRPRTESLAPEDKTGDVPEELPQEQPPPPPPPVATRAPGAYFDPPNSIGPQPEKRRGRPKKSIVITVVSDRLKDPEFLKAGGGGREVTTAQDARQGEEGGEPQQPVVQLGDAIPDSGDEGPSGFTGAQFAPVNEASSPDSDIKTEDTDDRSAIANQTPDILDGLSFRKERGQLRFIAEKRTIQFEFDGDPPAHEPIVLSVDWIHNQPGIRKKYGGDKRYFMLEIRETPNSPSKRYGFDFEDESVDHTPRADAFKEAFAALMTEKPDEPSRALGRPKKGKGKAKPKAAAKKERDRKENPNGYACEICGGVWKNEMGIKYHQTKAKTRCNPDYDPMVEKARRPVVRFALPPDDPSTARRSLRARRPRTQEPTYAHGSSAKSGGRPRFRRKVFTPQHLRPRAGDFLPALEEHALENAQPPKIAGVRFLDDEDDDVLMTDAGSADIVDQEPIDPSMERVPNVIVLDDGTLQQTTAVVPRPPKKRKALPTGRPDEAKRRKVSFAVDDANSLAVASGSGRKSLPSAAPELPLVPESEQEQDEEALAAKLGIGESSTDAAVAKGVIPPGTDATSTDRQPPASEIINFALPAGVDESDLNYSQLRRHRLECIVEFLLDSSRGVYPADKAMLYSVVGIYVKHFPEEDPPTWKLISTVLGALGRADEAFEQNYAFKNELGHFCHCRLLVRAGVDPMGPTARSMRDKVIKSYPQVYVPPTFLPNRRALEVLSMMQASEPTKQPVRKHKYGPRRELDEVATLNSIFQPPNRRIETPQKPRRVLMDIVGETTRKRKRRRDDAEVELDKMTRQKRAEWEAKARKKKTGPKPFDKPKFVNGREIRQNPGLDSLPKAFFGSQTQDLEFVVPTEPVLEDDDSDESSVTSSPSAARSRSGAARPRSRRDQEPKNKFAETSVLKQVNRKWPELQADFFNKKGQLSFTLGDTIRTSAELWLDHFPKSLEEILRYQRAAKAQHYNPAVSRKTPLAAFREDADFCRNWELSARAEPLMYSSGIAPHYQFINLEFTGKHQNVVRKQSLKWEDGYQDTVLTLPYAELDLEQHGPLFEENQTASAPSLEAYVVGERRRKPGPKPRKNKGKGSSVMTTQGLEYYNVHVAEYKKKREHEPFPQGPEDYFLPLDETEDYGVNWDSDEVLIAAFVVVGTLLGGVDKNIDWGIMMRIFPKMKVSALRRYWKATKKQRPRYIRVLTERLQEEFLRAYEAEELPPIDYDFLLDYDWRFIVAWTVRMSAKDDELILPAKRRKLWNEFQFVDRRQKETDLYWRPSYYNTATSVLDRLAVVGSEAATWTRAPDIPRVTPDTVAQSWIRSLACTPVRKYSPYDIHAKMLTLCGLPEPEIETKMNHAVKQLQMLRHIRQRKSNALQTERPFLMSDAYTDQLKRWSYPARFRAASVFKRELDEHIRVNGPDAPFSIPYTANEGTILALLQMQAHGRIRLYGTNLPHVPYGFRPRNYNSRLYPKGFHRFDVQAYPTERYIFNEDIDVLSCAADTGYAPIPGMGPSGEMPIWCDFFGEKDEVRWTKTLAAVVFASAVRGAAEDGRHIASLIQWVAQPFEIDMILEWCKRLGIASGNIPGGGTAMREWWWLVIAEMFQAKVPVEDGEEKDAIEEADLGEMVEAGVLGGQMGVVPMEIDG